MNKVKNVNFLILLLFLAIFACRSKSLVSGKNLNYVYEQSKKLSLEILPYHISNDSTRIYCKVKASDLLFSNESGNLIATFRIRLQLYDAENLNLLVDSANVNFTIDKNRDDSVFQISLNLATISGKKYLLNSVVFDLNRSINKSAYSDIDKSTISSPQNYLLSNVLDKQLYYKRIVKPEDQIKIESQRNEGSLFYINYYNRNYQFSSPPFSINQKELLNFNPDSTFSTDGRKLILNRKGFYHVRTDKTQNMGFTIYVFHDDYPVLTKPDQLLKPLRFITTQEEHRMLLGSLDQKTQLDNFWIRAAGSNKERAKNLIKAYYGNVQMANIFFSSYKEGWKTDRGMIFLIYGKPDVVTRTATAENWTYRKTSSYNAVIFSFNKTTNFFSDNDFYLTRSPEYKESWYVEVENWRKGYLKVN